LISPTTPMVPEPGRSPARKSRGAGASSARSRRRSRTSGRWSIVTSSRLVARISSSTVIAAILRLHAHITVPSHVRTGRRATMAVMERGTIVVVDDEPNIADLVDLYLARDGFRVLKAASGEAGLEAVRTHRPRLV